MKNIVVASIVAVALIVSSFLVKSGFENSRKWRQTEAYSLYGYEGVLYRLNQVNGRMDVLVPSNEAALLFPVGQIQLPRAEDKLTKEQKASFSQNIKTLSQYIQSERARSLGVKAESVSEKETK